MRESGLAPPISIVVPAYNEGMTILESVHSLLALRYPKLEVVVVNDGSGDDTLELLIAEFGLRLTPRVYWQRIRSKPVRGIYWSPAYPGLWVLDKVNGRKADAVNAGINLASAPYVCVMDGDSVLEVDAMAAIMQRRPAMLGGDRRRRGHRPDRQRLRGRPGRRHPRRDAEELPRHQPGARVSAGLSLRPDGLERAGVAHDRVRRVRRVPQGCRRRDRRLPARHGRARTSTWWCGCTATFGRRADGTAWRSCRTRCAGPSVPRR